MFKIAILILISNISFAESFNAKYISNYDGDTVRLKFHCNTPYFCDNVSVRIYGIDTPEIRTKDFCEKKKGYEAKDFVRNKLISAKKIIANDCQNGKYHREICEIIYDGNNLSDDLLDNNLATPYYGGKKQKFNWCK
jgi:endonuclease YncB( thermonuclease family)